MTYALQPVATPEDRAAMHAIRRATLFTPARPGGPVVYDENHPHDLDPANQCFLFTLDRQPIGVVRLDPRGQDEGIVRLVAIVPERQRQGHGRALGELIDQEARRRGMLKLSLNARADAVGFYDRMGWAPEVWDRSDEGMTAHCTQMTKRL
jgi:GNAT superfamily N-acetyltransferase